MKVKIYWNSHKKLFSILYKGKVWYRSNQILLNNVNFKVNQNGRNKVLQNKSKNVHAFVCGEPPLNNLDNIFNFKFKKQFEYNPYKYNSFVDCKTKEALIEAKYVLMYSKDHKPCCYYIE